MLVGGMVNKYNDGINKGYTVTELRQGSVAESANLHQHLVLSRRVGLVLYC